MITFEKREEREIRSPEDKLLTDGKFPDYQAYKVLYAGYVIIPIVAGADKYFNLLADWDKYLAPVIPQILGISGATIMLGVGAVEVLAGIITAFRPRLGGYLTAFWLWGIIVNLLLIPAFFDVALRDFGLSLGAWALAKLSEEFE